MPEIIKKQPEQDSYKEKLEIFLEAMKNHLLKKCFKKKFNTIPKLEEFEKKYKKPDEIIKNYTKAKSSRILNNVKKQKRTDEKIDKYFGGDSVQKMIAEENMCYMWACQGSTLLAIEMMKKEWLKPNLIIERIADSEYKDESWNPRETLHFAVSFTYQWQNYFINFVKDNKVMVGKWDYYNIHAKPSETTKTPRVKVIGDPIIIPWTEINSSQSIVDIIKPSFEENKDIDFEKIYSKIKEDLKNHNTDKEYEKFINSSARNQPCVDDPADIPVMYYDFWKKITIITKPVW